MNKLKLLLIALLLYLVTVPYYLYADESTIKIGADLELTGLVASFGSSCLNATKLYIEQINLQGGILGQKVELISADNQTTPEGAAKAASNLIQNQKVVAILGPISSRDCLGAAPIAQGYGTVLITPTATNISVTLVGDYIFRSCFIDKYQGTLMARFALEKLNLQKAAIINYQEDGYSKTIASTFKETYIKGGGQLVAEETTKDGATNFKSFLKKIMDKNPDLIFAPLYYKEAGLLAKQIRNQNISIPILGGDGWDSADLVYIAGSASLNNIFFCNHYSQGYPNAVNVSFIKAYQDQYGEKPDALAALAYDSTAMICQAIIQAKCIEPAKIRDALKTIHFNGVSGNLAFDADRNPTKTGVVIELIDGTQNFRVGIDPILNEP